MTVRKAVAHFLRKAAQRLDPKLPDMIVVRDSGDFYGSPIMFHGTTAEEIRERLLRDQRTALWGDLQGYGIVGEHGPDLRLRDYGA